MNFFSFHNLHRWWLSEVEKLRQKFKFWKSLLTVIYYGVFINYYLAFVIVNLTLNVLFTWVLIPTKSLFSTVLDYIYIFYHYYLKFQIVKLNASVLKAVSDEAHRVNLKLWNKIIWHLILNVDLSDRIYTSNECINT